MIEETEVVQRRREAVAALLVEHARAGGNLAHLVASSVQLAKDLLRASPST